MQRLIVVFNPRSTQADSIKEEVLEPARKLAGILVGKYEILPTNIEENAKRLAQILEDGDLVVAAGGDATALMTLNGCLESEKDVVYSALAFGNFNDTAATLGNLDFKEVVERFRLGEIREFYPLEVLIDNKHFRYAAGYMTVGMFAESTGVFDDKKVRKKLKNGGRKLFSYSQLARWYFRHKNEEFLPEGKTDYMAVNGLKVGGIMRGRKWFLGKKFLFNELRLNNIVRLGKFMARAILLSISGQEVEEKEINFGEKIKVMVQTEGESREVECEKIEIRKGKSLKAVVG